MLQVVKSESAFGQRLQTGSNKSEKTTTLVTKSTALPTALATRVFMDSLWPKALVKSVATAATPRRQVQALLFSWFDVPENLSRSRSRVLPASTTLPLLTVSNFSFGQDHGKSVNKRTRFETDALVGGTGKAKRNLKRLNLWLLHKDPRFCPKTRGRANVCRFRRQKLEELLSSSVALVA
ncbi:GM17210 [Drosophila sechellia]|uniref:GM17210 n=1 Tax=Drosophila sechellia TaxID=7238 RepID=B4I555_DROSE|nr:GM17210 [Drosophila sechellia]